MYETSEHLGRLQGVLDASYSHGGDHQQLVATSPERLDAARLSTLLSGVQELRLNTVSREGAPAHSVVEGVFYQGDFWFRTSPHSRAAHHIAERPYVAAACITAAEVGVMVHGIAQEVDVRTHEGLSRLCERLFDDSGDDGAVMARIDAEKIYTFQPE